MPDEPDVDFDAVMRRVGVERTGVPRSKGKQTPRRAPERPPVAQPHQAPPTSPRSSEPLPAQPRERVAATKPQAAHAELQAHYAQLERDHATASRRIAELQARYPQLERDHAAASRRIAELEREHAATSRRTAELAELQTRYAQLERDHASATRRVETLAQELGDTRRQLAEARETHDADLRSRFVARGLSTAQEQREALHACVTRHGDRWLATICSPAAIDAFLQEHLVLSCERDECRAGLDERVCVITVEPSRCDVCQGSDLRAAFEAVRAAAEQAGIERITIVGGSPRYRNQLQALARTSTLSLQLVDGVRNVGRRRARARRERIVIWAGTMLSHSTSASYQALGAPVVYVRHRGLCGMLRELSRVL